MDKKNINGELKEWLKTNGNWNSFKVPFLYSSNRNEIWFLDMLEDEREFHSEELERKITLPDSNRKILEEIKKHAIGDLGWLVNLLNHSPKLFC